MADNLQTVRIELEGGASIDVEVRRDDDGQWHASAPSHYPPLPTVAAETGVKALSEIQRQLVELSLRRRLAEADRREAIDKEVGPPDLRAVQFTYFWNLLQGAPDFGPGWGEEAIRELLTLSRSLARDARRAGEADDFLLWLGKRIAGEAIYSDPAKASAAEDSLSEWHTELAARLANASPWAPEATSRQSPRVVKPMVSLPRI